MDGATLIIVIMRGGHLATLSVLLGTLVCLIADIPEPCLTRLARWSTSLTLAFGGGWLIAQTIVIASPNGLVAAIKAVVQTGIATRFGHVLAFRMVLLAAVIPAMDRRHKVVPLASAALALASQPLIGHTGAGLIASEALHMLAAGTWLGALVPLLICVSRQPHTAAAHALDRFSPISMASVTVIAVTALIQGIILIGGIPALFGTRYGLLALAKLVLFIVLLGLAARNRFSRIDRLAEDAPGARAALRISIGAEIMLASAVLLAAAGLGSTAPSAHEQPVWPFPWRLDLDALALRANREAVALSLVIAGLTVAGLAASLIWRRGRLLATAVLLAALAWRLPSLSPLIAEAYPTSFFTSPTGFAASGIVRGGALFQDNCAACHGPLGRGDGAAAAALPVHPADLTEAHVLGHGDGTLFWWLRTGFQSGDGQVVMPAFGAILTDDERWRLIDFVRANAAGQSLPGSGVLPYPLPVPSFAIACAGTAADRPADLRGKAVRVITGADADSPALAVAGSVPVVRLLLTRDEAAVPSAGCVSRSADAWAAFAILGGVPPDRLAGTQFLIDPAGLIRRVWRPNASNPAGDPIALLAAVRDICENPATPVFGEVHEHHH